MTSLSDPELNTKRQSARKSVTQSYRGLILKPASCNELDLRVCCSGNENGPFSIFYAPNGRRKENTREQYVEYADVQPGGHR